MNVADLIRELRKYRSDLPVYIPGAHDLHGVPVPGVVPIKRISADQTNPENDNTIRVIISGESK